MWKQKDPKLKTVKDVVMKNTGLSEYDLLHDDNTYEIYTLGPVIEKFKEAANKKITVHIVGDYDVDGISATDIIEIVCRYLSIPYTKRVPNRHKEGYGLNRNIVLEYSDGILFTVDNGIMAFDAVDLAKKNGLFVIVTDHHQARADHSVPDADILIDPSAFPETADWNKYCGAGIAYKIAEKLLPENSYELKCCNGLAAIGTIADMVDLESDNKKIVLSGIKYLEDYKTRTPGVGALLRASGSTMGITSTGISFGLGPMINACGRLEGMTISVTEDPMSHTAEHDCVASANLPLDLLTKNFTSYKDADKFALDIKAINDTRKRLKKEQMKIVDEIIDKEMLSYDAPIIVYSPNLHLGIVGILAGEIVEKYGVPAIVLTSDSKGTGIKGSARSAGNVNMKELLDSVSDDLLGYGGHAGAAGLSLELSKLQKFREDTNEKLADVVFEKPEMTYDLEIQEGNVEKLIDEVNKYQPYGMGNPEPVFLIRNFKPMPMFGSKDIFKIIPGTDHIIFQGKLVKAPAFFLREKYESLTEKHDYMDIIGTVQRSFNAKGYPEATFLIKDLAAAENPPVLKKTSLFEMMSEKVNQKKEVKA